MMLRRTGAATLALTLLAGAPARAASDDAPAAANPLAAVRQQCIAAARETQERERAIGLLQHQIDLRSRDAAARRRDIDDSRPEQARLLGALAFLARNLGDPIVGVAEAPLDRARGELLIQAAAPAIRAEAHALADEIKQIAPLQAAIAADRHNLAAMEPALADDRARLTQLLARRQELTRQMLPKPAVDPKIATGAKTVDDLIKQADAAADRFDRTLAAARPHATTAAPAPDSVDPTRPDGLHAFDPPQSALTVPVSGPIAQRFGDAGAADQASAGILFAAVPGALVVAPFDGRVTYAGPFGDLGLVLIVQHGRLYHSLLAGLGRVEVGAEQWVLAGEPVGSMPAAAEAGSGRGLDFEMRREGRPVDPQPWLAADDEGRAEQSGEQRVHR
jgi:septal ring factor EnvC (AmiA/AmiB activator)